MTGSVRIEIAVYDLLPESRLATTFWYLGCGIHHTAVRIPELGVEFAYGGLLPSRGGNDVTGIFSIPSPGDPAVVERLMPGLRFIERRSVGDAFGAAWVRRNAQNQAARETLHKHSHIANKPLPPVPSASALRYPKMTRELSSTSLSGTPLLRSSSSSGMEEDNNSVLDVTFDADEWGRKAASGNESTELHGDRGSRRSISSDLARILAIIDGMKMESEWKAKRYSLLSKNCNNFTDELCRRLTGKGAPTWINRAAWLGKSLPCLVPQDWLEPPAAEDYLDDPPPRMQNVRRDADILEPEDRPLSPLIAIPYVETQPMHLALGYEEVKSHLA